jgi:carbohydrate diacid regulator
MFTNGTRGNINEMINTIRVYFENKMNVKDAATVMFLHRNTMAYRINKFKETYKIDITDPYECMLLYIASIMLELE